MSRFLIAFNVAMAAWNVSFAFNFDKPIHDSVSVAVAVFSLAAAIFGMLLRRAQKVEEAK